MPEGFIPAHGGYRNLLSYQRAEIVFDATVRFCARYFDPRDRTVDQMVQAARSGKQNIAEGSMASATSKETEVKLTNVAKSSLEELKNDYQDFLRLRGLKEWTPDHPHARRLSELLRTPGANYETFRRGLEHPDPAISANAILGIVKVTIYLLKRQIRELELSFVQEGGLGERMFRARLEERDRQQARDQQQARGQQHARDQQPSRSPGGSDSSPETRPRARANSDSNPDQNPKPVRNPNPGQNPGR